MLKEVLLLQQLLLSCLFCFTKGQFIPFSAYQLKDYKQKNPLRYFSPVNIKRGPWPNLRVNNLSKRTRTSVLQSPYFNPYVPDQYRSPYNVNTYKRDYYSVTDPNRLQQQQYAQQYRNIQPEKYVTGEKRQGPKYVIIENNQKNEPELYQNEGLQGNFQHVGNSFGESEHRALEVPSEGFTTAPIASSFANIKRPTVSGLPTQHYLEDEYTTSTKYYEPSKASFSTENTGEARTSVANKKQQPVSSTAADLRNLKNDDEMTNYPDTVFAKKETTSQYMSSTSTPETVPSLNTLKHVQRYELEKHGQFFFNEPVRPDLMLPNHHSIEGANVDNVFSTFAGSFNSNQNVNHVQRAGIGEKNALCELPTIGRKICGKYGIKREGCEQLGCCWRPIPKITKVPWCFQPAGKHNTVPPVVKAPSAPIQLAPAKYVKPCVRCPPKAPMLPVCCAKLGPDGKPMLPNPVPGKPPIGPDGKIVTPVGPDGKPKGATDPSENPLKPPPGQCDVEPDQRKECGYLGIKQPECEGKGCCWRPLENGSKAPWCYYPGALLPPMSPILPQPRPPTPPGNPSVPGGGEVPKGPDGKPPKGPDGKVITPVGPDGKLVLPDSEPTTPPIAPPGGDTLPGNPSVPGGGGGEVPRGPDGKPPKGPDGKVITPVGGPDGKPEGQKGPDGIPVLPDNDQCEIEPNERKECGYLGIKQPECEVKGCCWKQLEKGSKAPWCFFPAKKEPTPPGENPNAPGGNTNAPGGNTNTPGGNPNTPGGGEVPKGPDGKPLKGPDGKVVTPVGPGGKPDGQKGPDGTPVPPDNDQCNIDPNARKECGYLGIKQPECEGKGCCWGPLENGSKGPWCFFPAKKEPAQPGGNTPGGGEVPKGPDGKPPKGPDGKVVTPVGPDGKPDGQKGPDGTPVPPDNDQCNIDQNARKECGYLGIKQPECEGKGCCWGPLENGSKGPWCFFPAKKEPAQPGGNTPGGGEVPKGPDGKPPKGPDGKVVTPVGPDGKPDGQKGPDGTPVPPDNDQCNIDPNERKECGYLGIKQPECEGKGCCWGPLENGSKGPWCFFPAKKEPAQPGGNTPGGGEVPKGPDGKPPKGPDGKVVTPVGPDGKPDGQKGPDGTPVPPDNDQCNIDPNERKECGYLGIKQPECEGKGCCWGPLENGSKGPWCFFPAKKEPAQPGGNTPGGGEVPKGPDGKPPKGPDGKVVTPVGPDGKPDGQKGPDGTPVPPDNDQCNIDPNARKECGYLGIKQPECEGKGCCWGPLENGSKGPWCFFPAKKEPAQPGGNTPGGGEVPKGPDGKPPKGPDGKVVTPVGPDGKPDGQKGPDGTPVPPDNDQCNIDPNARKECGYLGIKQPECEGKGCCWGPLENGSKGPWCFFPAKKEPAQPGGNTPGGGEVPKGPDGKPPKGPDGKVVTPVGPDGKPDGQKGPDGTPVPPDNEQCNIDPNARKECGYLGIKQPECEGKGCCWGPLENGSKGPWCFFPAKKEPAQPGDNTPGGGEVPKGPDGKPPKGPDGKVVTPVGPDGKPDGQKGPDGTPVPPDNEQCNIDPNARKECGYLGIKQPECEGKGCCWGPLENGSKGPWCFFPAKKEPAQPGGNTPGGGEVPKGPDGKPPKGPDGKVVTPVGPDGKPDGQKGPDGTSVPPDSEQCNIDPNARKECGYLGIKQPECEGKGCCWGPLENGSKGPWCFFPAKKEPAQPGGNIPGGGEVPKGPDGKPSKGPDGKVVTPVVPDGKPDGQKGPDGTSVPPDNDQCNIEPNERKECGYLGIKQPECERKGCCWGPLENGSKGPWCFFPAKKEPAQPGGNTPGGGEVPKGLDDKPPKGPDGKVVTPVDPDGKPDGQKGPDGTPVSPDNDQCNIDPNARKECGYLGIKQPECEGKGCCWGPLENGSKAPWCFFPAKKEPVSPNQPDTGVVPKGPDGKPLKGPDGKVVTPVGPDGEPEGEKAPDGTPVPPDSAQCEIEPNERKECGYFGIKQPECEGKGCCWRPLEEGSKAPWCYFPAKNEPTAENPPPGGENPVQADKDKPSPTACLTKECQERMIEEMKKKSEAMYALISDKGPNHLVELYSLGCTGDNCDNAVGSIKVDGVEVGGGAEGMNVVVLSYPDFQFRYSKVYDTGKDAQEVTKLVQFIKSLKSPSVIMIVVHGEAFAQMTEEGWALLDSLACCRQLVKTPKSSFAMLTYKGPNTLPWIQVAQKPAGMGASAIYAMIGPGNEYLTLGGAGLTISTLVTNINDVAVPIAPPSTPTEPPESSTREHKDNNNLSSFEEEMPSNSNLRGDSAPIESESENEPQNPFSEPAKQEASIREATSPVDEQVVTVTETATEQNPADSPYSSTEQAPVNAFISPQENSENTMFSGLQGVNASYAKQRFTEMDQEKRKKDDKKEPETPHVLVTEQDHLGFPLHHAVEHPILSPHLPDEGHDGHPLPNQPVMLTNHLEHEGSHHAPSINSHHPTEGLNVHTEHVGPKGPEHDPYNEHTPFVGHLTHTGQESYNPHSTFVTQVYKPAHHDHHSGSQVYTPHIIGHAPDVSHHATAAHVPQVHLASQEMIHNDPGHMAYTVHPAFKDKSNGDVVALEPHHPDTTFDNDRFEGETHHGDTHDDGYDFPTEGHPPPEAGHHDAPHDYYHHEEPHHMESQPPRILNVAHPYLITTNQPMGPPSKEETDHKIHKVPIHPIQHHVEPIHTIPVHDVHQEEEPHQVEHHEEEEENHGEGVHPVHEGHDGEVHLDQDEQHEEAHDEAMEKLKSKNKNKPKKTAKKVKKPEKSTEIGQVPKEESDKDNIGQEVQAKLREMLTEELNNKLHELNLVPASKTQSAKIAPVTSAKSESGSKPDEGKFVFNTEGELPSNEESTKVSNDEYSQAKGNTDQKGSSLTSDSSNVELSGDSTGSKQTHTGSTTSYTFYDKPVTTNKAKQTTFSKATLTSANINTATGSSPTPSTKAVNSPSIGSGTSEGNQTSSTSSVPSTTVSDTGNNPGGSSSEGQDVVNSHGATISTNKPSTGSTTSEKNQASFTANQASSSPSTSNQISGIGSPSKPASSQTSFASTSSVGNAKYANFNSQEDNSASSNKQNSLSASNNHHSSAFNTGAKSPIGTGVRVTEKGEQIPPATSAKLKSKFKSDKHQPKLSSSSETMEMGEYNMDDNDSKENSDDEKFYSDLNSELDEIKTDKSPLSRDETTKGGETNTGSEAPSAVEQDDTSKAYEVSSEGSEDLSLLEDTNKETSGVLRTHTERYHRCGRYKILKSGKKVLLKGVKKICIEKSPTPIVTPMPNPTGQQITTLQMSPGYSTLPGSADPGLSKGRDMTFFFDNTRDKGGPSELSFKENVYADGQSGVYDQGDYVNAAESILQKDVRDAYNTANNILKAEEALDKSEQPVKKKRSNKRHAVYVNKKKKKRSQLLKKAAKMHKQSLEELLENNVFDW